MIWSAHLLLGAAIGSKINNVYLAFSLAFISHYILDIIPHIEYPIENLKNKNWPKLLIDIAKIFFDFSIAIAIILIFSSNKPEIYICAFLGILPDLVTGFNHLFPEIAFKIHDRFHKKIHFLEHKKISNFWRITSQVIVIIISIALLKH